MHPKLNWTDWVIAAAYLGVVVGIGVRFLRRKESAAGFFLADRSLGWVPVGFSLTATSISTLTFASVPAAGILHGWYSVWWLAPAVIVLPFALLKGLPWLRTANASTVYELLERSFGPEVRLACSVIFAAWRLLWTATIIYTAGRVILLVVGGPFPEWSTILLLSLVTMLYTYLGGMRAVVWTDVVQTLVMLAGVGCMIWLVSSGESPSVPAPFEASSFSPADISTSRLLISLAETSVVILSLYLADQITAQRFLAARSLADSRLGLLLHTALSLTLLFGLSAAGALLRERGLQTPAAQEVVSAPAMAERTWPTLSAPESTTSAKLQTLEQGGVELTAAERLLPIYISHRLSPGITALIGLALVAAAMSTFDSAVNSLGAVLHFDLDRRFGWGWKGQREAAIRSAPDGQELRLAKPLTWFLGVAAGLLSLALPNLERFGVLPAIAALNGVTAPMLGLILVAMLGAGSSARMACLGLAAGLTTTCGLLLCRDLRPDLVESQIWLSYPAQLPFLCGVIVTAAFAWFGRERTA